MNGQDSRRLTIDLFDNKVNFATFFIGYADKPFDNEFYSDILQLGSHTNENTVWILNLMVQVQSL